MISVPKWRKLVCIVLITNNSILNIIATRGKFWNTDAHIGPVENLGLGI